MRRFLMVLALFLVASSIRTGPATARTAPLEQLTAEQTARLQRGIESVLGRAPKLGDHGMMKISDIGVPLDGTSMIPVRFEHRATPETGAPPCTYLFVIPNKLANWLLTVETMQGFGFGKVGPVLQFFTNVPPGMFFWWYGSPVGCATRIRVDYAWSSLFLPAEFWKYWHVMDSNAPGFTFRYPMIGPRFTIIVGPGRPESQMSATSDSLGVRNEGTAYCTGAYNVETAACGGSSIPPANVNATFIPGGLTAMPGIDRRGTAVLVVMLMGGGVWIGWRRWSTATS